MRQLISLLVSFAILTCSAAHAAGETPDDPRIGAITTLNDYFPFNPPEMAEAWQARAEHLRLQLKVALGVWPMPTATPARAQITPSVRRPAAHGYPGYTVERVRFESFPGFFVTGNLYRPDPLTGGPYPAVLCPHGHWADGRFHDQGADKIKQEIVAGAERFDPGGRSPLQSRCVQLVRMGCVVFHYDMVGYADSIQIPHRPGYREHLATADRWGYFSPQAELRAINMMGLQTYDSIRALDFLATLPEVDPHRIAVTGASGGGTQTFILAALDPRPRVAFPAVMVSTDMQGGCTCENACYLRTGTGNVEIAALFAPKPLGMTAANDWTREIATKGFPELRRLYKLLGAEENVLAEPFLHFGHNYNYVSRAVMYRWINKHLDLGAEEPIVEQDYEPLTRAEMTVWTDDVPKPSAGEDFEVELLQYIDRDNRRQLDRVQQQLTDGNTEPFDQTIAPALRTLVGSDLPASDDLAFELTASTTHDAYTELHGLLSANGRAAVLPTVVLAPAGSTADSNFDRVVVYPHDQGTAGLFDTSGGPAPHVRRLIDAGAAVLGVDLLYQGQFLKPGQSRAEAQADIYAKGSLDGYAGYVYGYNLPLFAQRSGDLLLAIGLAQKLSTKSIDLIATDSIAPIAAAARAIAGDAVTRAAIDTSGFRFEQLTALNDENFLPAAVKYGDLPAFLAMAAPAPTWLAGESDDSAALVPLAYAARDAADKLTIAQTDSADEEQTAAAIDWLLAE